MAIDFTAGDIIIPNKPYVDNSFPSIANQAHLKQSLATLRQLLNVPSIVLNTGNLSFPTRSFIHVRPLNQSNITFRNNRGVVLYFSNDAQLNNSFETSEAFLVDKCTIKAVNNTGSSIPKNSVVRQTGFDATLQVPEIGLADATTAENAVVFGVVREVIADGACGGVLVDGSYQEDTSSFTIGAPVYLSNTPGTIATSAGTVETIIGRILSVGTTGTISTFAVITGGGSEGGGGGGSSGFFTDGTGTNAAIGKGDTAPTAAGDNGFAQGDNVSVDVNNGFASGQDISLSSPGSATGVFAQGEQISFYGYDGGFIQGKTVAMYDVSGPGNFAQGFFIYMHNPGYGNFAQGAGLYDLDFHNGDHNFIQGGAIDIGDGGTNDLNQNLIQGSNHDVDHGVENSLIQGESVNLAADTTHAFAQGEDFTISGSQSFAQGYNITLSGNRAFAQGYEISVTGNRGFAQGQYVSVTRDDQKTWGSNRTSQGLSQFSRIIKYIQTTDVTPTALLTFTTDIYKTYSIKINVAAKNAAGSQSASFIVDQVLATREGGILTLNGDPISLTKDEIVASPWTAVLSASGFDLILTVTGEAANTVEWTCNFEFVEVYAH